MSLRLSNNVHIDNGQARFDGNAAEAREELTKMAVAVTSGSGVKQGYLKIRTSSDKSGAERADLGLRWSRSSSTETQNTTALVKALVVKGFGDRPGVQSALENYLAKSGNKIGSQSFVKFVQTLNQSQSSVSGSPVSEAAQSLQGVRVSSKAKLSAEGIAQSLQTGHEVEKGQDQVQQELATVKGAAPQDALASQARLTQQMEVLMHSMETADAQGMNTVALQQSLTELNSEILRVGQLAAKAQAMINDPQSEVTRLVNEKLQPLRAQRDDALASLKLKVSEQKAVTAAFYGGGENAPSLAQALEQHAQWDPEVAAARLKAQDACHQLESQAKAVSQDLKQDWNALLDAQPRTNGVSKKYLFDSAVAAQVKAVYTDTQNALRLIDETHDDLGAADPVLQGLLIAKDWQAAFQHLKQSHGDSTALRMVEIAKCLQPPIADAAALVDFALKALPLDAASGEAVASWMRDTLAVGNPVAGGNMPYLTALEALGVQSPALAKEVITALVRQQGIVIDSTKAQAGAVLLVNKESARFPADMRHTTVMMEKTFRIEFRDVHLEGAHIVFKPDPTVYAGDVALRFNLGAAASLPAQVHLDFSDVLRVVEDRKALEGAHKLIKTVIADSGELSRSDDRQQNIVGVIDRLPSHRADLKVSMMRDVVQFMNDAKGHSVKEAWEPLAKVLMRDPVYSEDPTIRSLLSGPVLARAWQLSLTTARLNTPYLVETVVNYYERASPSVRKKIAAQRSEMLNQLFSHADMLDSADPLKLRIQNIEQEFLKSKDIAPMMLLLSDTGRAREVEGRWEFRAGDEDAAVSQRLMKGTTEDGTAVYATTSAINFDKMLHAPDTVDWSGFHTFTADEKGNLSWQNEQQTFEQMPALRSAFPLLQQAYESLPGDGATEVLDIIFSKGGDEANALKMQLIEALKLTANAPSPLELSEKLRTYLEPLLRYRGEEGLAGVAQAHYFELLNHADGMGLADNSLEFARYLHSLAVSYAFLSSDGALGTGQESVESLRIYALALHRESMHLAAVAPDAFKGYAAQIAEVDRMFTDADQCGHILAGNQSQMLKRLSPTLAASMLPARLFGDNLAAMGDGGDDAIAQEQARNAAMVRDARAQGGGRVRAAMTFGIDNLVGEVEGEAPLVAPLYLERPELLEIEYEARLTNVGDFSSKLAGEDPIARFKTASLIRNEFTPFYEELKAGLARVEQNLVLDLQRAEQDGQLKESMLSAETLPLQRVRIKKDQDFQLLQIREEAAAHKAFFEVPISKIESLFLQTDAILSQGPSQA
jgi:hypothetical protein